MREIGSNEPNEIAIIGEGTEKAHPVSMQVLQEIYHELTGKTESVSKFYETSFRVQIENLIDLDNKITHSTEQYNIKAINSSVVVYYIDDQQDTHSSFLHFKTIIGTSCSAIESVLITYDILIVLPSSKKPQSYSLSVRLVSRAAMEKKLRRQLSTNFREYIHIAGMPTSQAKVKYVDYAVAKNLMRIVDEWFTQLPQTKGNVLIKFLRSRSEFIPVVLRYLTGIVVAAFIFHSLPTLIPENASLLRHAQVLWCAFVGLFSAYHIADRLGRSAEYSVDCWSELSYISLNSQDKQAIEEAEQGNKYNLIGAGTKIVLSQVVSAIAKAVLSLVGG